MRVHFQMKDGAVSVSARDRVVCTSLQHQTPDLKQLLKVV